MVDTLIEESMKEEYSDEAINKDLQNESLIKKNYELNHIE